MLDESISEYESICRRNYCLFQGPNFRKKLESNFNKLFDEDFKNGILGMDKDEYLFGNSQVHLVPYVTYAKKVPTKRAVSDYKNIHNIISKDYYIKYEIVFYKFKNDWKIGKINMSFVK